MIKQKQNIRVYLLFLCLIGSTVFAQQQSQFTQYMYNTISVNPAYAGSRNMFSVLGLYRTQWVGLDGAPKTVNFTVDSPLSDRVGVGFSVINDQIGPSDETNIGFDVSYNIPVSDTYRLYFGMKASANLLNIDFTKLTTYNPTDAQFQTNVENKFSPNIGAGLYLQSDKGYVGVSVPNILETSHYAHSQISTAKARMTSYLIAGYVYELSYNLKFKPALLIKAVAGAPIQADLSANFLFNDKLTLGTNYRLGAVFSAMAGFQISDTLLIGYAYDHDTSKIGSFNSGSHEIFLRFDLFDFSGSNGRAFSPRFF